MHCWELTEGFGFEALRWTERPDPAPGPGEVLVEMRAVTLNYRDLLVTLGHYNPKMPLPRVPLSDGVGEVVAVGPGVRTVAVGERVASCFFQDWAAGGVGPRAARSDLGGSLDGVGAERVVLREDGVIPVPAHLNDVEGAALPCAALTAWNALQGGGLRAGDTVLVLGTGGVSIFALQLAAAAGARVIATSSSDAKLERARRLGAWARINYREQPDWHERVLELTEGRGVDHVIEVGGAGTLERSLKAVRIGGHVALIGVLAAGKGVNPLPVIMKAIRVQGVFVGSRAMFAEMNRFIAHAGIRPLIDACYPIQALPEALRAMQAGGHFGKIALRFEA